VGDWECVCVCVCVFVCVCVCVCVCSCHSSLKAKTRVMRTSEDSDDEIESVELTYGADPGKGTTMHITTLLSPFLSLLDTTVSVCRHTTVLLRAAVCECRLHQSQSNPPFMYMQF
jgi:hypothetical protein